MNSSVSDRITTDPASGCWLWTGPLDRDGYGTVYADGKTRRVHRYVYEQLVGPIGARQVLDHLKDDRGPCKHRHCCNPAHLQPVTVEVNAKRVRPWNAEKTHCPQGHPYDQFAVTYACKDGRERRFCRECRRLRDRGQL